MAFFVNFLNPPFHTDSHSCIHVGGPVASIGGPVPSDRAYRAIHNTIHGHRIFLIVPEVEKMEIANMKNYVMRKLKIEKLKNWRLHAWVGKPMKEMW